MLGSNAGCSVLLMTDAFFTAGYYLKPHQTSVVQDTYDAGQRITSD